MTAQITAQEGADAPAMNSARATASSLPVQTEAVGRLHRLDVLRAIAVLLVLLHHMRAPEASTSQILKFLFRLGSNAGWIGVDLFFVLSGYLVSGLIFREYLKERSFRMGRFLVRRGFKIYPAFYCLFLATLVTWQIPYFHSMKWMRDLSWANFVSEGVFAGNYYLSVWNHTWSLAVEEHFYIILSVLLFLLCRRVSKDPFQPLVTLALPIMAGALLWRIYHWYYYYGTYSSTHLRIDSLFFGVIIAYFLHFRPTALTVFERPAVRAISLLICAPVIGSSLILPLEEGNFWYTAGYTLLYLAFGLILIVCIKSRLKSLSLPLLRLGYFLASIGFYSYSIYLWHMPVRRGLFLVFDRMPFRTPFLLEFALFVVISVVVGIALAKLIEIPVLRFRDRYFPSRSGALLPNGVSLTK